MNRLFLACVLALIPSLSFGYSLSIRTSSSAVDYTSASDVGSFLAFNIFKLSLQKNNIPFDFSSTGIYKSVSGLEVNVAANINNVYLITYGGGVSNVVLWPRDAVQNHTCICDYAVICVFAGVRAVGSSQPVSWYIYCDYGVVSVINYLGSDFSSSFQDKSVQLVPNVNNSMPILVSDKSMTYFSNPVRVYNIYQNLTNTGNISTFKYGSLSEFTSAVDEALIKYSGSTFSAWSGDVTQSLQNFSILRQSSLPWQMQSYNANFNEPNQTRPAGLGSVDTDGGTEPDLSEYYTGHIYTNPSDDWGQPAEIGGGSGAVVGGEVTEFGPEAEQQLENKIEQGTSNALEDYFGSSSDLQVPTLDSNLPSEDRDDPETNEYFLRESKTAVEDILPDGVSRFQALVNRLRTPDNRTIQPIEISMESDFSTLDLGLNKVFEGESVEFDWNIILEKYGSEMRLARMVVVFVMYGLVIIYVIKDNFLIGNNSTAGE